LEQILAHPLVLSPNIESYRDWLAYYVNGRRVEGHESVLGRALQGEIVTGQEILYHRGDGVNAWICVSGAPIRDARGKVVVGVDLIMDIDEEKRAREALRINQERLNLAQKAARLGSFEWAIQTNEVIWSEETEAIYGLPPGRFDGSYEAWAKCVHPEDRPRAEQAVRRALVEANFGRAPDDHFTFEDLIETIHPDDRERVHEAVQQALRNREGYQIEHRVIWPDGSPHWVVVRGRGTYGADGQPL